MASPFLVTSEVASRLRCSTRTIHEMTVLAGSHRRLPGSRRCLFRVDELEAWENGATLTSCPAALVGTWSPFRVIDLRLGGRLVAPVERDSADG